MSVDLLRLRRGTSESNSRAIESKVRTLMRFRYSCNPGGDFEAQADTSTMWGPTVGDHMAVMGSPIGGCRMGPSRERDLCTREGFPFDPSR